MLPLIKVEPYWNVNDRNQRTLSNIKKIKVEPYWNVNEYKNFKQRVLNQIKVEPYWNVNVGVLLSIFSLELN